MNLDKNILNPDVAATARCHGCNEIVLYERTQCPYCGIKLDREQLRASALDTVPVDRAISSANTIRTFNPGAVLFLIASIANSFLDFDGFPIRVDFFFTYVCLGSLVVVGKWFLTHGRLRSTEPEYLTAKKMVKKSFLIWLGVNLFNLTFLILGKTLLKNQLF